MHARQAVGEGLRSSGKLAATLGGESEEAIGERICIPDACTEQAYIYVRAWQAIWERLRAQQRDLLARLAIATSDALALIE